ncbi:MAG: gamma-glutamyltransferase family protein [Armatimonadetes bacterium]|nr:gamma-glutamyltransferase family protein [Armatimonadota bacterium]MDW8123005.1 gamma-glutamyltransferase family protein [Armatimonadota bacterium]
MVKGPVYSHSGLVVSEHPLASLAGTQLLRSGGNAFDAGMAVSLALSVVCPHLCGLGGDFFALLYLVRSKSVLFVNGSGRAPAGLSVQTFARHRINKIPTYGPLTVTVPGLVKALGELHARFGTIPWSDCVAPAIRLAEEGFSVSHRFAQALWSNSDRLADDPGCRTVFFTERGPLQAGEVLRQPALAATLETLSKEGPEVFYSGSLAEKMVSFLSSRGCPVTLSDFHHQDCLWSDPVTLPYRSHQILEMPPNAQGIITLQSLALAEEFGLGNLEGIDRINLFARIAAVVAEERDRYLSDPDFVPSPPESLLAEDRISALKEKIGRVGGGEGAKTGDTTFFAAVDKDGNALAAIQSIFHSFGSGLLDPQTGILFHNRGANFVLQEGHPNCLGPKKRPRHTLSAVMILDKERNVQTIVGTSGGDWRPQIHLWILVQWLERGKNLQEAIEEPRVLWLGDRNLLVEGPLLDGALRERGWNVQAVPYPGGLGVAHGIERLGVSYRGCADVRGDGIAVPVSPF